MKRILTLIVLLTIGLSYGQIAVKKSSISTGGGSSTVGTTTVISAIGEIAVQEQTQGTIHLSEGFIGPDLVALGIEEYTNLQGVSIYPNPVQNDLNIELLDYNNYELYLFDLNGKQLVNQKIEDNDRYVLDLSGQKTGAYLLIVIDRKHKKRSIQKVIKR